MSAEWGGVREGGRLVSGESSRGQSRGEAEGKKEEKKTRNGEIRRPASTLGRACVRAGPRARHVHEREIPERGWVAHTRVKDSEERVRRTVSARRSAHFFPERGGFPLFAVFFFIFFGAKI